MVGRGGRIKGKPVIHQTHWHRRPGFPGSLRPSLALCKSETSSPNLNQSSSSDGDGGHWRRWRRRGDPPSHPVPSHFLPRRAREARHDDASPKPQNQNPPKAMHAKPCHPCHASARPSWLVGWLGRDGGSSLTPIPHISTPSHPIPPTHARSSKASAKPPKNKARLAADRVGASHRRRRTDTVTPIPSGAAPGPRPDSGLPGLRGFGSQQILRHSHRGVVHAASQPKLPSSSVILSQHGQNRPNRCLCHPASCAPFPSCEPHRCNSWVWFCGGRWGLVDWPVTSPSKPLVADVNSLPNHLVQRRDGLTGQSPPRLASAQVSVSQAVTDNSDPGDGGGRESPRGGGEGRVARLNRPNLVVGILGSLAAAKHTAVGWCLVGDDDFVWFPGMRRP